MGLRWAHCPELAFPFSSSGILEPDLHDPFLQPHFTRNMIKHFSGRIGIQQVFLVEYFQLFRGDGGSQAFIAVLVFTAVPSLLFTASVVFFIIQFPFQGSGDCRGRGGVGGAGLRWHLRQRAAQQLSGHQRVVGVEYHVGHVHGPFQERGVQELVLGSEEVHVLVLLPEFQSGEGNCALLTLVL